MSGVFSASVRAHLLSRSPGGPFWMISRERDEISYIVVCQAKTRRGHDSGLETETEIMVFGIIEVLFF